VPSGWPLRVVRDPAQAEEVTQEAYLEVWRTASRFDPDRGSALAWLLTIVHRKAVDRVRSAEAATRRDTSYHQQNQPVAHDATAEAAETSLETRRVRVAMENNLTEVQRQALELAYFGGYTHTEVATMLDLPVGTAKTRIRDGLIRLRDAMGVGR
jgi:RNA polymerase sigma-70 factor (ECF subfamily)